MNSSSNVIKPLSAGVVAYGVQKYYLNKDNNQAMYFGASVGAGMLASGFITPMLKPALGATAGSLMEKVAEMGATAGSAYALNKYVLKNESYRDNMVADIGTIVVANVASELIDDFLTGKPLNYFTD